MKKTILIVDDDTNARGLLRAILEPEGFAILEAEDAAAALDVIGREKVDLLITDRSMPGMSGLELLKRLQTQRQSLPSIMISAYGEDALWGQAIGVGAGDYILKPFAAKEVLAVVRKSLKEGLA
jgi:two-component system KDP operon response regulator KdpE